MFVGFSSVYSSDVPIIINPRTGHISPQFYVVFDDDFSTVPSSSSDSESPPFWNTIDLEENTLLIPLYDNKSSFLDKVWLTSAEFGGEILPDYYAASDPQNILTRIQYSCKFFKRYNFRRAFFI